jgi:hypothetical protein
VSGEQTSLPDFLSRTALYLLGFNHGDAKNGRMWWLKAKKQVMEGKKMHRNFSNRRK